MKLLTRYSHNSQPKFCLEFSPTGCQKPFWGFLKFRVSTFEPPPPLPPNSPLFPMETPKTSIFWKTSDHREKRSEIWDSWVLIEYKWHIFTFDPPRSSWNYLVHLRFLALLCATAKQSYCRYAGVRCPSFIHRPLNPFSQNPSNILIPKLVKR